MTRTLKQVITEMSTSGAELNVTELAKMELFGENEMKNIADGAIDKRKLAHVRNAIRSTLKSSGLRVLNVRKNVYKAAESPIDFSRLHEKSFQKILKEYKNYKAIEREMAEKGVPIQSKFSPELEEIERAAKAAKHTGKQTVRASEQPAEASASR